MKLSVPNRLKGKKLYTEIWKPIRDYEGLYEVSNMGRVKSLRKNKIIGLYVNKEGYRQTQLTKDGKCKNVKIARLILSTFNPIDNMEYLEVDHINTIRNDDRLLNLRWVNHTENVNNPLTRKHLSEAHKGENNPMYGKGGELSPNYGKHHSEETKKKMSESCKGKKPVYCFETNKTYPSANQCAKELGLWATNISAVCKGKCKQTGGYHFIYCSSNKYKNYLVKNKVD